MLTGIRIFTSDNVWCQIFADLGAQCVNDAVVSDVNFDVLNINSAISVFQLKSKILNNIENTNRDIIYKVFNKNVVLCGLQTQIIIILFKTGGVSISDLKILLGYASDSSTHSVDTAIYQLRKKYGREFIKNNNGKYFIGKL